MSTNSSINYIDTFFEFKELTKIHGEPTYESLKELHNQLKANACTVPSNLGGGQHGHLGLVLSPTKYALISNTPFVKPAHPGVYVADPANTQHMQKTLENQHKERLRVFNEVLGVERALRQQIVSAIEDAYLLAIRNRVTNTISMTVHEIMHNHLYPKYGRINPKKLYEQQQRVQEMHYDVLSPPDVVFQAVEDLCDYAEAANCPFNQKQAVNIAYIIFNRTGRFKDGVREWIRRPVQQKTWVNFKLHFLQAHTELRETEDLSLGDTPSFNQANLIQQMVCAVVQEQMQQMQVAPPTAPDVQETTDPSPPTQSANATVEQQPSDIMPLIVQQMQTMQKMMETMQKSIANNSNAGRSTRITNRYCWTHGGCSHLSKDCRFKANGHKDNATFRNKMGGSTKFCRSTSNE